MKRFKIVNKGGGKVTLMDTEGNLTFVNESVFRDMYTKVKDAFVRLKEVSGRIVMSIRGKVVNALSVFDIAKNHKDRVVLFGGPAVVSTAESFGIKTGTDKDFDDMAKREDPYGLLFMICDTLGKKLLEQEQKKDKDGLDEGFHIGYDPSTKSPSKSDAKLAYSRIIGGEDSNSPIRKDIDAWLTNERVDVLTKYLFTDVNYSTTRECERSIMRYIDAIFSNEIGEKSYKTAYERVDETIKMPILYGPGGVGKTALVKRIVKTLLSFANDTGKITGEKDKRKEYTGFDNAFARYRASKLGLDVEANFDLSEKDASLLVTREPKIVFVKCQNLLDVDIQLPSKSGPVRVEDRGSNMLNITDEAVRNLTTGLLPLIDTQGLTTDEILRVDEAFGPVLLIFDELFMAQPEVLKMIMGLVDSRKLGSSMYLPTQCAMIATTNRYEDFPKGATRDIILEYLSTNPVKDRYRFFNLLPTWEEFEEWATSVNKDTGEYNIEPIIFSIFKDNADLRSCILSFFGPDVSSEGRGLTRRQVSNTRSIEFISSSYRDLWYGRNGNVKKGYRYLLSQINKDQNNPDDTSYIQKKREVFDDFFADMKESIFANLIDTDAERVSNVFYTEMEGVPSEVYRSLWTEYDGKPKTYDRLIGVNGKTRFVFNKLQSPLGIQRLIHEILKNRPDDYDKLMFGVDEHGVVTNKVSQYHENLKNNMYLYYDCGKNTNEEDAVRELKTFAKDFMSLVLDKYDRIMIEKKYYDKNTSSNDKYLTMIGSTHKGDAIFSTNGLVMPMLNWINIKTPSGKTFGLLKTL